MPLLRIADAARLANTSRQRIHNAIDRGELVPSQTTPFVLLDSEDVKKFARLPKSKGGRPKKAKKSENRHKNP